MNYEQMGKAFDKGSSRRRKTRAEYKTQLEEFYKRYGLEDKVRRGTPGRQRARGGGRGGAGGEGSPCAPRPVSGGRASPCVRYAVLPCVQLDGVEAALDKWKGREDRMFDALNKKYDAQIQAFWDRENEKISKEEL